MRREIAAGRLRRDYIAGFQENLWDKPQQFSRSLPKDRAWREVAIDADGSVTPECRHIVGSKGLMAGNVSEGFDIVSKRYGKNPVLRALRELPADKIRFILYRLDPSYASRVELRALPYDTLDRIFANEETHLRAAFDFLRLYYWKELKPASQEAVTALEREWFPRGGRAGGAVIAPALPFIPVSSLGYMRSMGLDQI